MARRMEHVIGLDEPAVNLYQNFASRRYWEDLIGAYPQSTDSELAHFSSDESGTDITFTHRLSRRDLPSIVATVAPLNVVVVREQHFDPFDRATNSATGHYTTQVPAPLEFGGTYILRQTENGSELRLSNVCKVNVPLVGGKIEQWVLGGLRSLFDAERDFTREWIASHS